MPDIDKTTACEARMRVDPIIDEYLENRRRRGVEEDHMNSRNSRDVVPELLALLNAWLCRDLLDRVALAKLIGDTRKAVEHG